MSDMQPFERLEYEWAVHLTSLGWQGSRQNVVACASGTAALHLAFEALRLPQGSKVVTADFNMIACPRAAVIAGLTPVFVDCDKRLNLNPTWLGHQDWSRTKSILATHIYGRRCNMDEMARHWAVARGDVKLVEDMAELHGYAPHPATDAACWSFYKNKVIAGEEGGAVAFRDVEHAELARSLRCLGFTDAHDYSHRPRGWNHRMSNLHAVPILESLTYFKVNTLRRRQIEAAYDTLCPTEWRMPPRQSVWVYDLQVPGMATEVQDRVVTALRQEGIAARHGFKPMTSQAEWLDLTARQRHPNAYRASEEVIYLPCDPEMVDEGSVEQALEVIKRVIDQG